MGRLIDADRLLEILEREEAYHSDFPQRADGIRDAIMDVISAPTVDAIEVVRCRGCNYWKTAEGVNLSKRVRFCTYHIGHQYARHDEDFCSRGERKDGKGDSSGRIQKCNCD